MILIVLSFSFVKTSFNVLLFFLNRRKYAPGSELEQLAQPFSPDSNPGSVQSGVMYVIFVLYFLPPKKKKQLKLSTM